MSWITDQDAPHFNIPDEYVLADQKATPVDADRVLLEDSADGFTKKYAEVGDLPGGGGGGSVDVEDDDVFVAAADTLNFGSNLTVTDDGGGKVTVDASGGGGGGAIVDKDLYLRTAGNITLNGTSFTAFPTAGDHDMVVNASAGDLVECSMSALVDSFGNFTAFDWATMVSGSPVNWISGGATNGVSGWITPASSSFQPLNGSLFYVVQAGDISSGTVTFRPYFRSGATGNRNLRANANEPLFLQAVNYGQ